MAKYINAQHKLEMTTDFLCEAHKTKAHKVLVTVNDGDARKLCLAAWDNDEERYGECMRITAQMIENPRCTDYMVQCFLEQHGLALPRDGQAEIQALIKVVRLLREV